MSEVTLNTEQLKALLKVAIVEILLLASCRVDSGNRVHPTSKIRDSTDLSYAG
jgi:hypothetical protein